MFLFLWLSCGFLWLSCGFLWVMVCKNSKDLKSFCWVLIFWKDQISQILYIKYKPDVGFIAVKTHPKFNQNVAPDSTFATACRQACSSTHLTPPKLQSKRSKSFGKCGGKFFKKTSSEKQQKNVTQNLGLNGLTKRKSLHQTIATQVMTQPWPFYPRSLEVTIHRWFRVTYFLPSQKKITFADLLVGSWSFLTDDSDFWVLETGWFLGSW